MGWFEISLHISLNIRWEIVNEITCLTSVVSDKLACEIFIMTRICEWNLHWNHIQKKICFGSCWVTNILGCKYLIKTTHANWMWFEVSKVLILKQRFRKKIWNKVPRQFLKVYDFWVSLSSLTHDVRSLTQSCDLSRFWLVWSKTSRTNLFKKIFWSVRTVWFKKIV